MLKMSPFLKRFLGQLQILYKLCHTEEVKNAFIFLLKLEFDMVIIFHNLLHTLILKSQQCTAQVRQRK